LSRISSVSQTLFVFGLLVWAYVVAIQITHPEWLHMPLTHYDIPPFNVTVDDAGIVAFALSAVGFLLWRSEVRRRSDRS